MVQGPLLQNMGGLYVDTSEGFFRGTLPDISRTIKAEFHDAGVVVMYED